MRDIERKKLKNYQKAMKFVLAIRKLKGKQPLNIVRIFNEEGD
jgi:hypothetical protein